MSKHSPRPLPGRRRHRHGRFLRGGPPRRAGRAGLRRLRRSAAHAAAYCRALRIMGRALADRSSGRGRVYSWTVVEHQVHPAFPMPYTVVLVQLDDAPARLVGSLAGRRDLIEGQPMEVWFETLDDGVVVPQWKVA